MQIAFTRASCRKEMRFIQFTTLYLEIHMFWLNSIAKDYSKELKLQTDNVIPFSPLRVLLANSNSPSAHIGVRDTN
jgi:hypothetical protein